MLITVLIEGVHGIHVIFPVSKLAENMPRSISTLYLRQQTLVATSLKLIGFTADLLLRILVHTSPRRAFELSEADSPHAAFILLDVSEVGLQEVKVTLLHSWGLSERQG